MAAELLTFAGIVAALAVGTVSPGPSFVMVARAAVVSRIEGVNAALGMGAGGVVFAIAALLGLQAILLAVPALYLGLKVLGGLYLCYLGYRMFRSAGDAPAVSRGNGQTANGFWLGLLTQVSNPKTAVVYASVFAAFLPPAFSWTFAATLVTVVFCIEAGWYALVALLLSSARPQRAYLSFKRWIDRAAGTVMFGLGLNLAVDGAQPLSHA